MKNSKEIKNRSDVRLRRILFFVRRSNDMAGPILDESVTGKDLKEREYPYSTSSVATSDTGLDQQRARIVTIVQYQPFP